MGAGAVDNKRVGGPRPRTALDTEDGRHPGRHRRCKCASLWWFFPGHLPGRCSCLPLDTTDCSPLANSRAGRVGNCLHECADAAGQQVERSSLAAGRAGEDSGLAGRLHKITAFFFARSPTCGPDRLEPSLADIRSLPGTREVRPKKHLALCELYAGRRVRNCDGRWRSNAEFRSRGFDAAYGGSQPGSRGPLRSA